MNTNPVTPMKTSLPVITLLFAAIALSSCLTPPPKSIQETTAEARAGKVPDNLRDPRPEMPGMGPLSMPMH